MNHRLKILHLRGPRGRGIGMLGGGAGAVYGPVPRGVHRSARLDPGNGRVGDRRSDGSLLHRSPGHSGRGDSLRTSRRSSIAASCDPSAYPLHTSAQSEFSDDGGPGSILDGHAHRPCRHAGPGVHPAAVSDQSWGEIEVQVQQ